MIVHNRDSIIDKLANDHSLITFENVLFNVKEQMDIDVFFDFLRYEGESCFNSRFSQKRLLHYMDSFGNNLLHMAEVIGYGQLAAQLLACAPQLMYQTNQWGHYPAHFACLNELGLQKYPDDLLLCESNDQHTLLHVAAAAGSLNNVKWLLKRSTALLEKTEFLDGFPLHAALNIYSSDPDIRMKKIMTARVMLQYLSAKKIQDQLYYKGDLGVRPQDWIESRLTSQEVDFLFA